MTNLKQIIVVSIFAALASGGLHAQSSLDLRATVPFAFRAGNTLIPAGEYMIHEESGLVRLRAEGDGHPMSTLVTFATSKHDASGDSRLVFDHYGNEYFLTTIWDAFSDTGRGLPKTSRQKELAERNGPVQPVVVVATK